MDGREDPQSLLLRDSSGRKDGGRKEGRSYVNTSYEYHNYPYQIMNGSH